MAWMVAMLQAYKTGDAEIEIFTSFAGDKFGVIVHFISQYMVPTIFVASNLPSTHELQVRYMLRS